MTRVAVAALSLCAAAFAQTIEVAGRIEQDTTWKGEVRLMEDVVVASDVTLKIEPGTRILPMQDVPGGGPGWNPKRLEIHVAGRILARGRRQEPIRFGQRPPGVDTKDNAALWLGILLLPKRSERSEFFWCSFENAIAGVQVAEQRVLFDHCVFRDSAVGVATRLRSDRAGNTIMEHGDSVPTLRSCLFWSCDVGVSSEDGARPDIERCVFLKCRRGIGHASFGETYRPNRGVGSRVERCEFLDCDIGIVGGSRVTNSVFTNNRVAMRASSGHDVYTSTIDRYLRANNLYANNERDAVGDVPLGAPAEFNEPARVGKLPVELPPGATVEDLRVLLTLTEDSPGKRAASDGGDVGAFGKRGTKAVAARIIAVAGLVADTYLMCGPPGTQASHDRTWARARPRAGRSKNGALWVLVRNAHRPSRMPGLNLLRGSGERGLVTYIDTEFAQTVELRIGIDGRVEGYWNSKPIVSAGNADRVFEDEIVSTVGLRKGRNQLTLFATPARDNARFRVRFVTRDGKRPPGLSVYDPKERKVPLRIASIKRRANKRSKTRPKYARTRPVYAMEIRFTAAIHWEDAVRPGNYVLQREGRRPYSLKRHRISYLPAKKTVVIHGIVMPSSEPYALVLGSFRDAFGRVHKVRSPTRKISFP